MNKGLVQNSLPFSIICLLFKLTDEMCISVFLIEILALAGSLNHLSCA
jgi:hypothetical protein